MSPIKLSAGNHAHLLNQPRLVLPTDFRPGRKRPAPAQIRISESREQTEAFYAGMQGEVLVRSSLAASFPPCIVGVYSVCTLL